MTGVCVCVVYPFVSSPSVTIGDEPLRARAMIQQD
jgi:hypothetical protein